MAQTLPAFAPFPAPAAWRDQVGTEEWEKYMESVFFLAQAHLHIPDKEFEATALRDDSLSRFLLSIVPYLPVGGSLLPNSPLALQLKQSCFFLAARAFKMKHGPKTIFSWEFLSDLCRLYGKRRMGQLFLELPASSSSTAKASLSEVKKLLVRALENESHADLRGVEERLKRVNYLIDSWPTAAALFLAGSDYPDALISCFRTANPPVRKCIVTNIYLCLLGLTEGSLPKLSQMTDVLYSLSSAAQDHKAGPLNKNDSLVVELVTTTPVLQQLKHRTDILAGQPNTRLDRALKDLAQFRRGSGKSPVPYKLTRRKYTKRKADDFSQSQEPSRHLLAHQWNEIEQIQDLFPDLGSAFVAKLLDAYGNDPEQVVAHLLEDDVPKHLQSANRSENLYSHGQEAYRSDTVPRPTPPLVPERMTTLDDDPLDSLFLESSKLHFGKRESTITANDVLGDHTGFPAKASILSALAAFDSDDDERDDTYDAADIGGAVNDNAGVGEDLRDTTEEALFRTYQEKPDVFGRESGTRRSHDRVQLRDETGMTDEAIEGWGLMLARNPQQRRRLEAKFSAFSGAQPELLSTSWRANDGDEPGTDGGTHSRGRHHGTRKAPIRGRGGNRGDVSGPPGERETENARRRKEAGKASRANHNRRDQRAKKMAKGGFAG